MAVYKSLESGQTLRFVFARGFTELRFALFPFIVQKREIKIHSEFRMSTVNKNITLPSNQGREDPIYKPAINPCSDPKQSAAFIFIHGLADSAVAIESKTVQVGKLAM